MQISYKDRIISKTITEDTTGTSVQQYQTEAINMAWACVSDE